MLSPEAKKKYIHQWYLDHIVQRKIDAHRDTLKKRADFDAYKKTLKCAICGETATECLDFHHLNPEEKDNCVSALRGYSMKRVMREVAKCVVLCANCHRKVHSGRIKLGL